MTTGKFWITDDFIRIYAKQLSIPAQMVYIALCCHANKEGLTFVGYRTLARELELIKTPSRGR